MNMNMNLNMVQTQKLVMTPELKQAIEMLQYSQLELNEFIQEELMTNPVLEIEEPVVERAEVAVELDWKRIAREMNDQPYRTHLTNETKDDDNTFEQAVRDVDNLTDHLLFQLQFAPLESYEKEIARFVIENLDQNGYLDIPDEEVMEKFIIDRNHYESILEVLHTFEPIGICARNLKECLLIQIRSTGAMNTIAEDIVMNYLGDLADNRMGQIAKSLNHSIAVIQAACDFIKTLEPKPGRLFYTGEEVRYIIPDVVVEKTDEGYQVIVSESTAPKLHISSYYQSVLNSDADEGASDYIHKKLNAALKLIKSIEQRRNTIQRVVVAIIDHQFDFFEKGPLHLRTLTLKEIADQIGVHESTVSRAVSGKYLQCKHGLFEIKFFFQSGVSSEMGEGVSAESIKKIIKEQIDLEDPKKPLSDQHVTEVLIELGIKISRRTVAKYREEMLIPATSKRKRF